MATSTPPTRTATASATAPDQNESFTSMSDNDLEAIGAHCQYSYCNQLDFLPFRCSSCKGKYCLEHRTETAHACTREGEWAAARRRANLNTPTPPSTRTLSPAPPASTCALPSCSTRIHTSLNVGVHCPTCQRDYCLPHRMGDSHLCSSLTPLGARPAGAGPSQAERARIAFAKLRAWSIKARQAATQVPAKQSSSAAPSLAALKTAATGDTKVPAASRVYVRVEAEAEGPAADNPRGSFFFAREARVGRVLDDAAKGLGVKNVNNRGGGEESRLRVFHVEGGRVLGFGERLAEEGGVKSGHTLVLLRGLGAAEE